MGLLSSLKKFGGRVVDQAKKHGGGVFNAVKSELKNTGRVLGNELKSAGQSLLQKGQQSIGEINRAGSGAASAGITNIGGRATTAIDRGASSITNRLQNLQNKLS